MTLQSKRFLRLTAASTALVFSVGCASTTIIRSEPGEANLYIDGSKVGTTPYTYQDTKIVGSSTRVKITKEGYKDFETVITRDEEFQVGPCIGGFFVLVPWLWIMGYKPEHNYDLQPAQGAQKKGNESAQAGAPAAPGTI